SRGFPTVAIGGSAGGVHALQNFFESLPDTVNAAFVVILHLDPEHQSELPVVLAARSKMAVTQVSGRTRLEPGHVYVIPPNLQLLVTDGHLTLAEFNEPRWRRAPIDLSSVRSPGSEATISPSFCRAQARTDRSASRR